MLIKKMKPFIKHGMGDLESAAERLNRRKMKEIFSDNAKNKKEAVRGIGNDNIRQNGMGVVARGTLQTGNMNQIVLTMFTYEINKMTFITGKRKAGVFGSAERTDFKSG